MTGRAPSAPRDVTPADPARLHLLGQVGGPVAGALDEQGRLWAYPVGLPTSAPDTQHSFSELFGVGYALVDVDLDRRCSLWRREVGC